MTRPKLRQTIRTHRAAFIYEDVARCRFVVYRRAGGVTRKTSVRYATDCLRAREYASENAARIARRLRACPAENLVAFKF
jgi:hypothetical protein